MKRTPDDIPQTVETCGDVTIVRLQPGRLVFCDDCGEDYTDRPDAGGVLFQSKALCPTCAPKWESNAKAYGEMEYLRARCPDGMAFADWVRDELRATRKPKAT